MYSLSDEKSAAVPANVGKGIEVGRNGGYSLQRLLRQDLGRYRHVPTHGSDNGDILRLAVSAKRS